MKKIILIGLAGVLIASLSGCEIKYKGNIETDSGWSVEKSESISITDEMIEENEVIESEKENLELDLEFGVGELSVEGGAESLLETDFKYNVERLKPEVTKETDKDGTYVKIKQTSANFNFNLGEQISDLFDGKGYKNDWTIKIKDGTKLKLNVDNGVGETRIDLKKMDLDSVEVDCGVGDLRLDVAENYGKNVDISVQGGVGDMRIYVPKDMGVEVKVSKGIGDLKIDGFIKYDNTYRNRTYEEGKPVMKIVADMGVGSIRVVEE